MFVTGVQASGSKGLNSVQVAAVDTKEAARIGGAGDGDSDGQRGRVGVKPGEPEPIVFPRQGVPLDQRPVALKHEQALKRYAAYGGEREQPHGRQRRNNEG
jgi:hypothetical protein